MSFYDHAFETEVVTHNLGSYTYTVVFLPEAVAARLPLDEHPRLRMTGEVGDIPVDGAWQPSRGRWYLMLNKRLLKDGDIRLGDVVEVRFNVVDQASVDIPEPLARALAADPELRRAWDERTPGTQRGLAHRVGSAKRADTVSRRLDEVLRTLRTGAPLRKPGGGTRSAT